MKNSITRWKLVKKKKAIRKLIDGPQVLIPQVWISFMQWMITRWALLRFCRLPLWRMVNTSLSEINWLPVEGSLNKLTQYPRGDSSRSIDKSWGKPRGRRHQIYIACMWGSQYGLQTDDGHIKRQRNRLLLLHCMTTRVTKGLNDLGVTALCSEGPMFRRSYVQKVLCSEGPMFRRFYVQKVLYAVGSMFRRFYVQKYLFRRSYV